MMVGTVATPPLPRTAPAIEVPKGACDCHVHVHGPYDRFPLPPERSYASPEAPVTRLIQRQEVLGLDRVVIVQWSAYGTNNACTAEVLRQLWPRARGVAAIDGNIPETALEELAQSGFRGARVLLMAADAGRKLQAVADRIRDCKWHLEVGGPISAFANYQDQLAALQVPLVIDHFGDVRAAGGLH